MPDWRSGIMISLDSWWAAQAAGPGPGARAAWLVAGVGAALFGVSALLLKTGTLGWDESLFRVLNEVLAAAAAVLTPLPHLFLSAGITLVVVLAVVYVVARNRSVLPVAAGAAAAGLAWALAYVAKAIVDRPRPNEVMGDAVLRQEPAHGTSSSFYPHRRHRGGRDRGCAVPGPAAGGGRDRLCRPGGLIPGVPGGALSPGHPRRAGIGLAAGGVIKLAVGTMLRRAGRAAKRQSAAAEARAPRAGPEPAAGHKSIGAAQAPGNK